MTARPVSNRSVVDAMGHLVAIIQELSLARDLDRVIAIVRHAARELTGADGATFVLREGDLCYYADEDAIAPLWKGSRFPMSACISGWAMLNRQAVVIEDIYADPRVPADAYRPTFVKSLAMVPIRTASPVGAIGTYWAQRYRPTPDQVKLLQALADSTSCAMESVRVYQELEARVAQRTADLETFTTSVSHDLRSPLQRIAGYASLLQARVGSTLDAPNRRSLQEIESAVRQMNRMIVDLLTLARTSRRDLRIAPVRLDALVRDVIRDVEADNPARLISWSIGDLPEVEADAGTLRQVFVNLLSNAAKYTRPRDAARIEIVARREPSETVITVRDNGVGFDMAHAGKLFGAFQRLHPAEAFEGTGVGLANVRQIVERHGGRVWAEAAPDAGAAFHVAIPIRTTPL